MTRQGVASTVVKRSRRIAAATDAVRDARHAWHESGSTDARNFDISVVLELEARGLLADVPETDVRHAYVPGPRGGHVQCWLTDSQGGICGKPETSWVHRADWYGEQL